MEFSPALAMALLVVSIINFLKYAKAKNWSGAMTQIIVWTAGVVVVLLAAQTDFATSISVGDEYTLATLNFASLILIGLTLASIGSFATEIKKAIDNTDSAKKPPLLGG